MEKGILPITKTLVEHLKYTTFKNQVACCFFPSLLPVAYLQVRSIIVNIACINYGSMFPTNDLFG